MALECLQFTYRAGEQRRTLPGEWSHSGVTGSGDLEILMEQRCLNGEVAVQVMTPVKGYDHVWQRVLERFVEESGLFDVYLEINDNNATPFVVALRLKQALAEAAAMSDDHSAEGKENTESELKGGER